MLNDRVSDMARKRSRQSRTVHDHHGHCQRHVPAVPAGQTDPEDAPGQVRGKRRLHEQGGAEGDQRTSGWHRHDFRAATVRRRKPHRSKFTSRLDGIIIIIIIHMNFKCVIDFFYYYYTYTGRYIIAGTPNRYTHAKIH